MLSRRKQTILIADDELQIRTLMQTVLFRHYKVIAAANGVEALTIFTELRGEVDLVLLDLTMKPLSGLQVAEKIKSKNPNVPVILMSGYDESVVLKSIPELDFLHKPFFPVTLLTKVKSHLDLVSPNGEAAA